MMMMMMMRANDSRADRVLYTIVVDLDIVTKIIARWLFLSNSLRIRGFGLLEVGHDIRAGSYHVPARH